MTGTESESGLTLSQIGNTEPRQQLVIGTAVVDRHALPPGDHQSPAPQPAEVLRDRSRSHLQHRCEIADAEFAGTVKKCQDLQSTLPG